jgi:hypothetical protein
VLFFVGHASDIQMINPMYNDKEMNTYEIIRKSHPEDSMYTGLNSLDVTKIGEVHGYYDVAKPVEESSTHAPVHSYGRSARYPGNSPNSQVFGQIEYDEIPATENQMLQENQQNHYIDGTYLTPQPSIKR